jgi:hypothetical protein
MPVYDVPPEEDMAERLQRIDECGTDYDREGHYHPDWQDEGWLVAMLRAYAKLPHGGMDPERLEGR